MTARISVTPNPATPSAAITICYDFSGGATSPVTLSLDWDPAQSPTSITLSADEPCKEVLAGAAADGLIISDDSGQSSDAGVVFG